MKTKIKEAYNLLGEHYHESRKEGTGSSHFYNELLEMPTTLSLIGNVKGKRILDLGCGPGFHAKKFTESGAKVKGIDISQKLIKLAKKEAPQAELIVGDIEKRLPYKKSEFDIVVSSLVFGHIKDWNFPFNEINRVLKKGGIFVLSTYNPVAESVKKKKWFFKKFYAVDNYFQEKWRHGSWHDKGKKATIAHHHKTFGTVIKYITKNGFDIIDYEDCKPRENTKEQFQKDYTRTINTPVFCVWKLKKK